MVRQAVMQLSDQLSYRWSSKLSYLEETLLAGAGKDLGMFTLEVNILIMRMLSVLCLQRLI